MDRRAFLYAGTSAAVGLLFRQPDDDEPTEAVKRVLATRFGSRPLTKGHVQFDIPENAPDGRAVPVFIETDLPMTPERYVKAFHLLVDHNPDIYLAGFTFSPALGAASIDTRIRDAAHVLCARHRRDVEWRVVRVGEESVRFAQRVRLMATGDARVIVPAGIKAGDVIYVRAIIEHPMDTGFFRTPDGQPIPAYFIQDVTVRYGEDEIAHYEWTSGVSRDPSVTFALKAVREAPIAVTWKDNKGGVYHQSADVRFAPQAQ